jgi:two-component system response regulator GlrR
MKKSVDNSKILVVDDDKNILKVIKLRVEAAGFAVTAVEQTDAAIKAATETVFDLALVDLKLASQSGIELMEKLHRINPEMPIIILTAFGTIDSAVQAMQKGAFSYLTKPFDYHDLLLQIDNSLENSRFMKNIKSFQSTEIDQDHHRNIICKSEKMKTVFRQAIQAAKSNSNIYIEGESGTGKELIARLVHTASPRKDKPFVVINCAAIPENLLESELFGYEKGAFTGAANNKQGLLTNANGGTFFLDEISEMPLAMQVKLLRVIQEREFYPLGSSKIVKVDVRIIATSNRDLKKEVEQGNFREDLFYRIHVIQIDLPPLRERNEDIPQLAKFFLKQFSEKASKAVKGFAPAAIQKLMLYDWPGNVRELKNEVERAVVMTNQDLITEDIVLPGQEAEGEILKPLKQAKEEFEKDYLERLIDLTSGNVSRAAELSGKYRADLYELLKKHELDPADYRKPAGQ